jgi:hypothetical protein
MPYKHGLFQVYNFKCPAKSEDKSNNNNNTLHIKSLFHSGMLIIDGSKLLISPITFFETFEFQHKPLCCRAVRTSTFQ